MEARGYIESQLNIYRKALAIYKKNSEEECKTQIALLEAMLDELAEPQVDIAPDNGKAEMAPKISNEDFINSMIGRK